MRPRRARHVITTHDRASGGAESCAQLEREGVDVTYVPVGPTASWIRTMSGARCGRIPC